MKVYKLIESKTKYRVKWIELAGSRQEKNIVLDHEKTIISAFAKERNALKELNARNELSYTRQQKNDIKIETIDKVTRGVYEITKYSYTVEPLETKNIYTFKNGKVRVFINGKGYDCEDTKPDQEVIK